MVLRIGTVDVVDGQQLRALIRGSVREGQPYPSPGASSGRHEPDAGRAAPGAAGPGRTGRTHRCLWGARPEFTTVQYGPLEGAVERRRAYLAGVGPTLRDDGAHGDRRSLAQEHQRPADDRRLCGRSASMGLSQYLAFLR